MTNMEFSDFAQALGALISDGQRNGLFVQTLFEAIVDYEDEDNNPLFTISEDTLKRYYSGRRNISELASTVSGHLNKPKFAEYIDSFSDDVKERIYEKLSPCWPSMDVYRVGNGAAALFEDIILSASEGKRGRKPAGRGTTKQMDAFLREEVLVNEAHGKCPLCGKRLIRGKTGNPVKQYECISVVPAPCSNALKAECDAEGYAFPIPDSLAGLIVLCPSCSADYRSNWSKEKYKRLMDIKDRMRADAELEESLDRIEIEKELVELLDRIDSIGDTPEPSVSRMSTVEVKRKIEKDNHILANQVTDNVVRYYRFVEEQLVLLQNEGALDFESTRIQIHSCFLKLEKAGFSQNEIVDTMEEWLADKTGCESKVACRIVISFFIQACEVFREIAE